MLGGWFNPRGLVRTLTSPAYLGTMALCGLGLWAADRYATGKWRGLRLVAMGALGAGVGYGILAPLFPPLAAGAVGTAAAAAASAPASAPAAAASTNKQFEPAQGVESSGVFVGQ